MNVQTLPPGYKTAPWTPPEKIDGKMLADASAKLIDLLRIRTQPIGMRLFEDPADMEKIQGVRKPTEGFKFTMCQMVTQSRWYGFTLGITVDNTRGGNCGGVVGLNHPGEGFLSGDHMNGVWFGNKEASAAHQAQMPRVPDGKYNGLVVSPLRSARSIFTWSVTNWQRSLSLETIATSMPAASALRASVPIMSSAS